MAAVDTRDQAGEQTSGTRAASPPRWRRFAGVALAGALVAFLAVLALPEPDPEPAAPEQPLLTAEQRAEQRQALEDYLRELKPLTEELGFLVVHGLRAGVNDIQQDRFDDETLEGMPRSWRAMLQTMRPRFEAVDAPEGLTDAHAQLVGTIDGYVGVTELLSQAVEAAGERRVELASEAARAGERVDREWNLAAYEIQRRIAALGGEMVLWLPDPRENPDADDYVDGDPDEDRPNEFID
jgi:hypothetical protein